MMALEIRKELSDLHQAAHLPTYSEVYPKLPHWDGAEIWSSSRYRN